jgi:hypothetical protein
MKTTVRRALGVLLLSSASGASAQDAPRQASGPGLEERLARAAAENRYAVTLRDGTFSGAGWDLLLEEGRSSRFFLVGEEHGVAEVPVLVRELFRALQPAGYDRLAIEVSAPLATALDELARGPDGLDRLTAFFRENPPGVAFFTMREEAELLVAARAAVDGPEPMLWGLDYEVMADRYLLDRLRQHAPAGAARAAADALYEKSAAAWSTVSSTKNPAAFFTFAATPDVLDDLRRAWPEPDDASALTLDLIARTLAINQFFMQGRNWESNDARAQLNRAQLLRHLDEARARGPTPRVLFKFGASHMVRGRNMTEVFDIGSLAAELAVADGSQSFHLLVTGGAATEHAVFNPIELTYVPAPATLAAGLAIGPIVEQAHADGFTLIDLRPLRPLLSFAQARTAHPELMRVVHGFDAVLVLTGSGPSQPLR